VVGIDWRSGKVAWTFRDPDRQFPYMSCAAVRDGLVVVGGRDKRVHCLSAADGAQRWEFAAKGRVDSSPVLVGPRVFVGASDGVLYEFDLEDGKERWRFETGSEIVASPAVAGGRLVISTLDGAVCCFGAPSRDGG
jgi:outer membrane protein assembly factor BamB